MKYEIDTNAEETILYVSGQLTYSDRDAVDAVIPRILSAGSKRIVIDMQKLEYMDSSGLGMLLTIRDQTKDNNAEVIISRPGGEVKEMLKLACVDTLFSFRYDD